MLAGLLLGLHPKSKCTSQHVLRTYLKLLFTTLTSKTLSVASPVADGCSESGNHNLHGNLNDDDDDDDDNNKIIIIKG